MRVQNQLYRQQVEAYAKRHTPYDHVPGKLNTVCTSAPMWQGALQYALKEDNFLSPFARCLTLMVETTTEINIIGVTNNYRTRPLTFWINGHLFKKDAWHCSHLHNSSSRNKQTNKQHIFIFCAGFEEENTTSSSICSCSSCPVRKINKMECTILSLEVKF